MFKKKRKTVINSVNVATSGRIRATLEEASAILFSDVSSYLEPVGP